ncbi:MAG: C4-type zinc ribbon domain-containing protein [Cytophagales bacterium]|nr:C4-type zinc ribbon domain-containing protein [Bernardetiaceae bacterium]MDW8211834.1 C4-type zinc ribbon domain-containing protein [Cytophagales bacterium]
MENSVAKKLEALLKLQQIDSKLDEIEKIRGDLPEEVQDLEDEMEGYQTRIAKFNEELKSFQDTINQHKQGIKDAERLIEKYQAQQKDVRNSREFTAISKEIELQELEIEMFKKKNKELELKIEGKKKQIEEIQQLLAERQRDLENKRKELEVIIAESEEEEAKLFKEREKCVKNIDPRLYKSYMKIRENSNNGLAVVMVKRDACGGCFNVVPPQRQVEIREQKKIIICEHCGRILAGVETVVEDAATDKNLAKKAVVRNRFIEERKAKVIDLSIGSFDD